MSGRRIRLDDLMVERNLAPDAETALRMILANEVLVDDVPASSRGMLIDPDADIRIRARRRYVSRGGEKLKGAVDAFDMDVSGLDCLDIGSSTGGFTDCLLQEGAEHVACVDVNYGQLAWKVRQDQRVTVFERTNIKKADPVDLGAPFDLIVIDVSFIGLASLAPDIARFSTNGTKLLALVKPQFESKRGEAPGGVVEDEDVRFRTVEEVCEALTQNEFEVQGTIESPIKGPSGNVEYLVYAIYNEA